jgi:hypothetical protein
MGVFDPPFLSIIEEKDKSKLKKMSRTAGERRTGFRKPSTAFDEPKINRTPPSRRGEDHEK